MLVTIDIDIDEILQGLSGFEEDDLKELFYNRYKEEYLEWLKQDGLIGDY